MTETIYTLPLAAIALGFIHAFEADHVAAVTTLVTRAGSIRHSSLLGVLWGMGHTTTLFIVGIALLLLRVTIPEELSALFETAVAVILIALGVDTIRKVRTGHIHAHTHTHGGHEHTHLHVHHTPRIHDHGHTSFVIGLFHGLAGSGALALAAVASTNTVAGGALFIALFGLGSVVGMAVLSAAFGYILVRAVHVVRLHTAVMYVSGTLCIAVAFTLIPVHEFIRGLLG